MTTPLLEIENLHTFFYTDTGVARAVDGVSFDVGVGETVGVVGESGCGKSVTALSILRLVRPPGRIEAGSVMRFEGRDLLDARRARDAARPRQSHRDGVPGADDRAQPGLHDRRSDRRGRARSTPACPSASAWAKAIEMLKVVGIPAPEQRAGEYPHQLSGGMRQRVVIAMALVMNPALVIADEPTTALDVTIQAQILELLADLTQRLGTSVLLITHDLGVVAENCTRVIVMYAGEVVEEATTTDLFARAHHPYTEGLLGAMPRVGGEKDRLATIPGTVPPPTSWPKGCRFRDRCPYSWERCETEHPPLYQIGGGHTSRCHLAEEPERRQHPHPPLAAQRGATAA